MRGWVFDDGVEEAGTMSITPYELDVMVPYYQGGHYLASCMRSLAMMRGDGFTVTVVDDAGPGDDAARVVRECVPPQLSHRFRVIRNEERRGIAGNFTRCIELADGPLVAVVGYDDVVLPGFAEGVIAASRRWPSASVWQCRVGVIDGDGRHAWPLADKVKDILRPPGDGVLAGEELAASLLHGDWLYFPSLVWRTADIACYPFNEDLGVAMDLEVLLQMAFDGAELAYFGQVPLFHYRRHTASASGVGAVDGSRFVEERELFQRWARMASDRGWKKAHRAATWHVTSRLHAVSQLPGVRSSQLARQVLRHTFGTFP